jgi:hypothetical protein
MVREKGAVTMGVPAKGESLIEWSARLSGWAMYSHRGDFYTIQSRDCPGDAKFVTVNYRDGDGYVKFSSIFPLRFSLERTPQGLFARLMLRTVSLHWAAWAMDIQQACEAQPYLVGIWPTETMTPRLFNMICLEMVGEIRSMQQELRDKFSYGVGDFANNTGGGGATGQARVSVQAQPGRGQLPTDGRGMRFLE